MRITNTFLHEKMLADIQTVMARLVKAQDQLSSGKRILAPSDDPLGTSLVLRWKGYLSKVERWKTNISEMLSRYEMIETNLSQAKDLLMRARDIVIRGSSDSLGPDEKRALADEMDQIISELLQRFNAKYGDRYLFAGAAVLTRPFEVDASGQVVYHGAPSASASGAWLPIEIGEGVTMPQNIPGDWVTMVDPSTGVSRLFKVLITARDALRAGKNLSQIDEDGNDIASSGNPPLLSSVDEVMARLGEALALVGARVERLQGLSTFYDKMKTTYEGLRSQLEDADVAEVYITYSKEQLVYQSALKVASNILTPSLIDYLR